MYRRYCKSLEWLSIGKSHPVDSRAYLERNDSTLRANVTRGNANSLKLTWQSAGRGGKSDERVVENAKMESAVDGCLDSIKLLSTRAKTTGEYRSRVLRFRVLI